jgi:hypothetical protein
VEDDEAFSLRDGIARHIEYSSDIISITVTGLTGYDLLDCVPKANGSNKRLKGVCSTNIIESREVLEEQCRRMDSISVLQTLP